jgi:hypothetical protein
MDRTAAKKLLIEFLEAKRQLDQQWQALNDLTGCTPDSDLGLAVWRPVELLIDRLGDLLGDQVETLRWFVWDNDLGERCLGHSLPCGRMLDVCNVDDLLEVMGVS